jgi:mono/diheme cytochrome c family protein
MCRHKFSRGPAGRAALMIVGLVAVAGCRQDMADQPKLDPLEASTFFRDGMASRQPVPGTVARGQRRTDAHYFTGRVDGEYATSFPPRLLEEQDASRLLRRGRDRYEIFCSHCHGRVGGGSGGDPVYEDLVGMVVRRGYSMPATFHQDRLREAPPGRLFDVITNGFRRMPRHDDQIPVEDRWAIVAYIRALQLSQHAEQDMLEERDLRQLPSQGRAAERKEE